MIRVAADLGDQNIPAPLVQQLMPLQTLYWRVATGDNKTIEVWNDSNSNFYVVEGNFSDNEWGMQDLKVAYEAKSLSDAKGYVKAYYNIAVDDNTQPQTAEITFKRLIKKSERLARRS